MIGIRKTALQGKNKAKRVRFTRFRRRSEEKNTLVGREIFGCDCRGGRLRRWLSFRSFMINGAAVTVDWTDKIVVGAFPFRLTDGTARIVLVGSDGYAYVKEETGDWTKKLSLGVMPSFFSMRVDESKVYYFLASMRKVYCTLDGVNFTLLGEGEIGGTAIVENRLFIAYDGGRVAYSAPFAPEQFGGKSHEGGTFYLPADFGEIIAIGGAGRYLYLFGYHAVYRASVKADGRDFVIEPLAYTGGTIIARSVMEGGARVMFLAQDGLYCVRGEKIEKIFEYLSVEPNGSGCTVGRFEDVFLLEYFEKNSRARWLALSIDGEEGGFLQRLGKLCGSSYFFKDGTMCRFARGDVEANFDTPPYFQSGWEWFDSREQKTLKRLVLRGKGNAVVKICNGDVTHEYTLSLQNGEGSTLLCERGRAFTFRLLPAADCEIEDMTVEYVTA